MMQKLIKHPFVFLPLLCGLFLLVDFMLIKTKSTAAKVSNSNSPPLYGGYIGPNAVGEFQSPKTVQQILNSTRMLNDMPVQLTGRITSRIGGDYYEFLDETGSIYIEIDEDKWQGIHVSDDTLVTIIGEIEYEYKPIIEVESIKLN